MATAKSRWSTRLLALPESLVPAAVTGLHFIILQITNRAQQSFKALHIVARRGAQRTYRIVTKSEASTLLKYGSSHGSQLQQKQRESDVIVTASPGRSSISRHIT